MLLLVPPTRTCLLSPRLSSSYFQSFVGLATRLPHPKNLAKYAKSCMYSPIRWNYRKKATVCPLNHRKVGAKKYAWRRHFISFLKELHVQTANLGAESWRQEDQSKAEAAELLLPCINKSRLLVVYAYVCTRVYPIRCSSLSSSCTSLRALKVYPLLRASAGWQAPAPHRQTLNFFLSVYI